MSVDLGALFGRGFAFPPRLGEDGRWALSEGPENVRESIRVILLTELQERLLLPRFGGGLGRYLFRPNTVATHRLVQEAITQALGRWEPRVDLRSVTVEPHATDPTAALATLRYDLIANRAQEELTLRLKLGA